ncbi:hypothetical protein IGI04_028321 [Brassica rapa subsp. trilocularis]|uniref:Uncharacterized protein n=1 Tax=Brassica rapa subsp. trilocularis TaxID=1813537 RepID=A0ABQ7L1L1_BRACM|nr:hypothetical protein IGI04_028321 [Brassica rapa subsp. trilocularis]
MTTGGTNPDTSAEEPELTPPQPPPLLSSEFMSSVMARLAHQEEVQKTTNDKLAAIVAALSAPTGNSQPFRRHLFNTNPPTPTDGRTMNPADPHVEPRQHATSDKNNRKNGLLYVVDENGKKWNTFHRETDPPSESPRATATAAVAQVDSAVGSSRTPPALTKSCKLHGDDDGDASADEDQPAVRQRIEVIRAQPEPSSDEESDLEEALDPSDLRTLLKRKITPTSSETPGPSDLRV